MSSHIPEVQEVRILLFFHPRHPSQLHLLFLAVLVHLGFQEDLLEQFCLKYFDIKFKNYIINQQLQQLLSALRGPVILVFQEAQVVRIFLFLL